MVEIVDPKALLSELRWTADRVITNYDGDRVWLKQIKGGITDCCLECCPCEYHSRLTHSAHPQAQ